MDVGANPYARPTRVAVGKELPHDSAHLHVSGAAMYTDDLPEPRDLLHLAVGLSARAHARIKRVDLASVREFPGVVDVCVSTDIPGRNNCGPLVTDEPILASDTVEYAGQPVFAVAANTVDVARTAVNHARLEYEELEAVLNPREAMARASFVLPTRILTRGYPEQVLEAAPHRVRGQLAIGGQDHFYLEGQVAMVVPQEDGGLLVYSSTQHPDEVQELVASATGRSAKDVVCVCRRMGGAFGGKETQAATIACIAAVMAVRSGAACKLRLDRDTDMLMTGKRHDFAVQYDAGFDATGRILGIEFMFVSRCGISADLSGPVNDRMMFHCDNAYFLENARIVSHRCKTNTVSNTAFRGFGGPQGMFAIEYVIDDIARTLGLDPLLVRRRNFYADGERNVTPYGQTVEDNIIEPVVEEVASDADYFGRRQAIGEFNESSPVLKRGIALTPVKFGISFTATHLNQAGALVHVYRDGTVHLNHGGTEMGQGLFIKVAQVVADELGITVDRIRLNASDTSKIPNASATAASSGSDLNGKAAQQAAATIRARLAKVAERHFAVPPGLVEFRENRVLIGDTQLRFEKLAEMAWRDRVMLWALGYYKTPKVHFDRETYQGRPFFYYSYGAAVSEVIVDTLTGEYRLLRVDIVHDCGDSLNPAIDLGQIEGGFVQGAGWLTSEELAWDETGALMTHSPSTYKIPTCSDLAPDFRVRMLKNAANRENTIYRSKAVGEPPLMLAISVFHAIRDAIATDANPLPKLHAPATPEAVLRAIEQSWQ